MDNVNEKNEDLNIIYEKSENNQYRECSEDDKETEFLRRYTKEPKSLDVDDRDDR